MGKTFKTYKINFIQNSSWTQNSQRKGFTLMDKITEIRIEEVFDENNQHYYWIYYFKNEEIKIIGKSSVRPVCYKQIARYIKWTII